MKKSAQTSIHVSIAKQLLTLKSGRKTERTYPISTSKYGVGAKEGSLKTPTGKFRIAEKFGDGLPIEIAFKSRKPLRASAKMLRGGDLIMSRILWLDGLEPENANSYERYIYIHGTNHEEEIGKPGSHGCVRMRNADVAELFDLVDIDTPVLIVRGPKGEVAPEKVRKPLRRGGRQHK